MSGMVLVVDDALEIRMLAEALLSTLPGVTVLSAGTAAEALALHRRHDPDVMLLDYWLPDLTAPGVLDALAARGPSRTRTVLFTAGTDELGPEHSVAAVLPKPFRPDSLLDCVQELLP